MDAFRRLLAFVALPMMSCGVPPESRAALTREVNPGGDTELHMAAFLGLKEDVARLMKLGAPLEARNASGETPLHCAVDKSRTAVVEFLISAGADVNARTEGENPWSPLDYALDPVIRGLLRRAGGVSIHKARDEVP